MSGTSGLDVEVVKAVRAAVRPPDLRAVLVSALAVPEIGARVSGDAGLAVRITGDRELRRLNRQFLDEDHPTDVLAFPSGDVRRTPGGARLHEGHLGDLAISWPAVRRQAAEHGHTDFAELALLAVHGLLHLLGWDHETEAERREMTRLTLAALGRAGIEPAAGRI